MPIASLVAFVLALGALVAAGRRRWRPRCPRACRLHLAADAPSGREADSDVVRASPRRPARRASPSTPAFPAADRARRCPARRQGVVLLATARDPGSNHALGVTWSRDDRQHQRADRTHRRRRGPGGPCGDSCRLDVHLDGNFLVGSPAGRDDAVAGRSSSPPQIFGLVTELDLASKPALDGDRPAVLRRTRIRARGRRSSACLRPRC